MKKFCLFALVATMFAACVTDGVNDPSVAIEDLAPKTLTVSFEGADSRIQLNEVGKTVWTKGDLVSVFYRSNANQKWQFQGETGDRTGGKAALPKILPCLSAAVLLQLSMIPAGSIPAQRPKPLLAAVGALIARVLRHFHAGALCKETDRIGIIEVFDLHGEVDHAAALMTAEAVIDPLIGRHRKITRLF